MTRRRTRETSEMAISEHELNSMTSELDMLHKETFPSVHKTLDEFSANLADISRKPAGRRSFLMGMGGVVVLGGVAACSSSKDKKSAGASTTCQPRLLPRAARRTQVT